ncbi:MAG: thioredoxin domain-containing protein [Actinobacteria bacterium]|nr:thioredoxin domain-containing protein [Actinomycetota bacterium]
MNRLAEAASPYLRQHADNPIDWWPWGPEALAEAERRDVPILLSVGYSACHWCHVMAHESFSDPAVAELVNPNFVAIKVDREERPDIDAIYMKATQALTGQGGWPMTVFCTPDGRPFFAGTYYPPEPGRGLPSFTQVAEVIAEAWRERRDEAVQSAAAIREHLAAEFVPPAAPDSIDVWGALGSLGEDFDPIHGGFGTAPKFPQPGAIDALLVKGEPGSLDVAQRSLEAMARGGIVDQLGGGFHRYSVDAGWVVPHFEKMLYDNALLLGTYTRGWRRVPDHEPLVRGLFERTVRGIVGWLEREMELPGGGFAASLDADSLDVRGVKHEGVYYVWNPELLADALGEEDADWAAGVFHVTSTGSFEHGLSTLQLRGHPDAERLASVSEKLLAVRRRRWAPDRDDKLIAAWNGWTIDSLVWAATVYDERDWLDLAERAASALWGTHWVDGRLRRTSLEGVAGDTEGLAEDYGAVAQGFARLAGALGEPVWLERAVALLDVALARFGADDGGFHDTADDAEALYVRPRDVSDNPTPSGTSALVAALRLTGLLADRPEYLARADAAALTTRGLVAAAPRFAGSALTDLVVADEARTGLSPAVAVVVTPDGDPLAEIARATWRMAPIGTAVVVGRPGSTGFAHHFDDRGTGESGLVYVCRGTVCFAPASEIADLRTALWSRA